MITQQIKDKAEELYPDTGYNGPVHTTNQLMLRTGFNKGANYVLEEVDKETCSFAEWIESHAVKNGFTHWKWRGDNFEKRHSTTDLLALYRKEKEG